MVATLRNRNFSLLWLAGFISLVGNWTLIAALPFHIYSVTESALATSGWLMAYILPGIFFSSIAGVFVDRWDRRKTMLVVSLLQAVTIPWLLLVQSPEFIWVVYVVGFVESALSHFFMPAESALLPLLVDEEQLVSANSLNALNDNLARIVGPMLGGLLLSFAGLNSVVLLDAVSYLLAALLVALVVVPKGDNEVAAEKTAVVDAPADVPADGPSVAKASPLTALWQELIAGLATVRQSRILTSTFIIIGIALFGDAILGAVLVVFVQDVMGADADGFGWILTARGLGGVIGGLLVAQVGQKMNPIYLLTGGLMLTGGSFMIILAAPTLTTGIIVMLVAGPAIMAWIVSMQTILQQASEDAYRGRIFGTFGMVNALLMFVGSGLAGGLADVVGSFVLIAAAGVIYIVAGCIGWVLLHEPLKAWTTAAPELG